MATSNKPVKELSASEHNDAILAKCSKLEAEIAELKKGLKPAELPKQASLVEIRQMQEKLKKTKK